MVCQCSPRAENPKNHQNQRKIENFKTPQSLGRRGQRRRYKRPQGVTGAEDLSDTARRPAGRGRMARVIIVTIFESFEIFDFSMILVIFRIFQPLGWPGRPNSQ